MIEAAMVATYEVCTDSSPMTPNPCLSTKKASEIKSLRQFTETLDVKHRAAVFRFGAAKANLKAINIGNVLWSNISKRRGHTKINQ